MGSPEKGVALARSHTHSGILADRTVSQIIGVLLTAHLFVELTIGGGTPIDLSGGKARQMSGMVLMNACEKDRPVELLRSCGDSITTRMIRHSSDTF